MSSSIEPITTDPEQLRERMRKLAQEKSNLQLVIQLIERLNPLPGVENLLQKLTQVIIETIGGTNTQVYYRSDNRLFYADALGERSELSAPLHNSVHEVLEHGEMVEERLPASAALMRDSLIPNAWHWTFPLKVGNTLIGAVRLENLHVNANPLRGYLPFFFGHVALILSNELHSHSQLAQANEKLRRANDRLRQTQHVVDQAPLAIYWVEATSTRFIYINDAACASVDYPHETLLNLRIADIDPHWTEDDWLRLLNNLRRQGSLRFETEHLRRDGQQFPVEITLFLTVFNGQEVVTSFVADISQRKADEARLLRALEEANSANRMKSVFLANMSHELRTPLNAILGFAQLMERDPRFLPDQRDNLRTINQSGQHLLALINDVLENSRIEAGRLKLSRQPFDLHELLNDLLDIVQLRARDKGLDIQLEIGPETPAFLSTDLSKLRQILLNLLTNAVKYTPQGQILISVSATDWTAAHADLPARCTLACAITDTGVGITEADQESIFQAFFQTESSQRLGEGTGLGLTLCREYTSLLGGQLSVHSNLGEGSCFTLRIPVDIAKPIEVPVQPAGRAFTLAPGHAPVRAMVVENHPESRRLLCALMAQAGFEIRSAEQGQDAIEQCQSQMPDLILMDIRMPVLDGFAATRQIRTLPHGGQIPIVALTASVFVEDRKSILDAGCNDILTKPVDAGQLFALLSQYFNLTVSDDMASSTTVPAPEAPDPDLMPPELRERLREAALALDYEGTHSLLAVLHASHPAHAQHLSNLAEAFRFEDLQAYLEPTPEHTGQGQTAE